MLSVNCPFLKIMVDPDIISDKMQSNFNVHIIYALYTSLLALLQDTYLLIVLCEKFKLLSFKRNTSLEIFPKTTPCNLKP